MRGGFPQRIHDAVELILRVGLRIRIPNDFLAENHFSINDGGRLAIAAAQIEANPATVQVTAQRRGGGAGGRNVPSDNDFEGPLVNPVAHDIGVEFARCVFLEMPAQGLANRVRAIPINTVTAPAPQQKFYNALDVSEISRRAGIMFVKNENLNSISAFSWLMQRK